MRNCIRVSLAGTGLLLVALLVGTAVRADDPHMTAAEAAALPKWCLVYNQTSNLAPHFTKDPELAAKLAGFLRSGCGGHHHYCWALVWANRGYFRDESSPTPANHYYGVALGDFGYTIGNSRDTCSLLPDIYTKSGELQAAMGHPKEAEALFRKVIGLKPSYAPAYVGLSDLFESQDKSDEAITALQAGIKINPNSSALKKKLARVQARTSGQVPTP